VTKIISLAIVNLVTPKAGAKHELLFNKPTTRAQPSEALTCLRSEGKLKGTNTPEAVFLVICDPSMSEQCAK
jgi:hypothetical protein